VPRKASNRLARKIQGVAPRKRGAGERAPQVAASDRHRAKPCRHATRETSQPAGGCVTNSHGRPARSSQCITVTANTTMMASEHMMASGMSSLRCFIATPASSVRGKTFSDALVRQFAEKNSPWYCGGDCATGVACSQQSGILFSTTKPALDNFVGTQQWVSRWGVLVCLRPCTGTSRPNV
jgi:hypothetical protein